MQAQMKTHIPKDIYMCYKKLELLEEYAYIWKDLNPEYTLHLYDDIMCIDFLRTEYSQKHADIFKYIPDGPIKADFWRICVLYRYGGLYVDADIEPFVPLREYIDSDTDFVTCFSYIDDCFNPHFILAAAGNEILYKCIQMYIKFYDEKKRYEYWDWSVVYIMNPYLRDEISGFKKQVMICHNKKYQFLQEEQSCSTPFGNYKYCTYNGMRVLNNSYKIYNSNNHEFKTLEVKPISKIIHHIAPKDDTTWPDIWKKNQQKWKDHFPNWELKLWKYTDIDKYMRIKFFWFHRIFRSYSFERQYKVFQYFVLYEYGGIYADMNYECTHNFEKDLPLGKVCILENETDITIEQSFIASPSYHIFWEYMWEYLYDIKKAPDVSHSMQITKILKKYPKFYHTVSL